jgi:hypothetical protein
MLASIHRTSSSLGSLRRICRNIISILKRVDGLSEMIRLAYPSDLRTIQAELVKNNDCNEVVVVLRRATDTLASGASKVAKKAFGEFRITRW